MGFNYNTWVSTHFARCFESIGIFFCSDELFTNIMFLLLLVQVSFSEGLDHSGSATAGMMYSVHVSETSKLYLITK